MQKEHISDGVLIKLYIDGNENALSTLVKRHKSRVFTSIYMLVNDRYLAEDIFQETFIKVINCIRGGKYSHEDKFVQWVMRIARNLSIDTIRNRKIMPQITDSEGKNIFDYISCVDPVSESRLIEDEEKIAIRHYINQLPDEQKEVLILRHYGDLSFKEIAELTNSNLNTCIGRMHYALLNLRKMMQKSFVRVK